MAHEVQKAHQGGVPDHGRRGPRVSARRGQDPGIIGEQFLTEVQLLLDRIVEPVDASTGGECDGHIRGEAEDLGRDGAPHADGLGHLGVLPERRGAGIAWARLRHPERTSVDPREGEAEQPTKAQQAREPGAQTPGTGHRVSSGVWPNPPGPGRGRQRRQGPGSWGAPGHRPQTSVPEHAVPWQLRLQRHRDTRVVGRSVCEAVVAYPALTPRLVAPPWRPARAARTAHTGARHLGTACV